MLLKWKEGGEGKASCRPQLFQDLVLMFAESGSTLRGDANTRSPLNIDVEVGSSLPSVVIISILEHANWEKHSMRDTAHGNRRTLWLIRKFT